MRLIRGIVSQGGAADPEEGWLIARAAATPLNLGSSIQYFDSPNGNSSKIDSMEIAFVPATNATPNGTYRPLLTLDDGQQNPNNEYFAMGNVTGSFGDEVISVGTSRAESKVGAHAASPATLLAATEYIYRLEWNTVDTNYDLLKDGVNVDDAGVPGSFLYTAGDHTLKILCAGIGLNGLDYGGSPSYADAAIKYVDIRFEDGSKLWVLPNAGGTAFESYLADPDSADIDTNTVETFNFNEASGNTVNGGKSNFNLTATSAPARVTGLVNDGGNAYQLDATSNSVLQAPAYTDFRPSGAFTVACVINTPHTIATSFLFDRTHFNTGYEMLFYLYSNGQISFRVSDDNSSTFASEVIVPAGTIPANTDTHIVATFEPNDEIAVWVDKVKINATDAAGAIGAGNGNTRFNIGSRTDKTTLIGNFKIDGMYLVDGEAWNLDQVVAHYNVTKGL